MSQKPKIFLTHTDGQPEQLGGSEDSPADTQHKIFEHPAVRAVTYCDETQISEWMQTQKESPLVIRVTGQTHLGQLFDDLHVRSERTPHFGRNVTQLQQALQQGREVVILGLEKNPVLQQALESLCCHPPSVMVNGSLLKYPKARLCLLWPQSKHCISLPWREALQSAEPLPEVDMWRSAASRHGIDRDQIPETALDKIYTIYGKIPKDVTQTTGALPVLTHGGLDNLIVAAQQAQSHEGFGTLEPRHWRKAINSVLTHCTRQHPPVRDFMKVACEKLLPDQDNQEWVDPDQLAQYLRPLKKIDRAYVQTNFWHLARACGPGVFKTLKLDFMSPNQWGAQPGATDVLCALLV
ncbi:hypothetical protein, partial [Sansalvadorimonas verongulae]|uniref:hypothetical protein n=1 Tax=Sansalvadorimonas verongulae TaxID=2172824 RepID=UPI0012BCADCA